VYMFDVPSDKTEVVEKALTALADVAGGLSLTQAEVDKERGVVIEEWRGGLGAGSRIRDKQFPVLFHQSRYAERLPIGKPEILRTAPGARLRAFYDTWYRPELMAVIAVGDIDTQQMEQAIKTQFTPITARAPKSPDPDRKVPLHQQPLIAAHAFLRRDGTALGRLHQMGIHVQRHVAARLYGADVGLHGPLHHRPQSRQPHRLLGNEAALLRPARHHLGVVEAVQQLARRRGRWQVVAH